ncbi:MAG: malto-oligosyltrehalose synthase, partial [Chloroflexi bacterium]|nr:malto-oligosyltrehalose synthase [Chloroflexota bacterium]
FRELQTSYVLSCVRAHLRGAYPDDEVEAAVASWLATRYADGAEAARWPLYVVAEKILARGERLPEDWAVDGTTGYDFANAATGLFVDAANRRAFDAIYSTFVGQRIDFRNVVNASKKMIMLVALASEISVLGHQLNRISEGHRWYRDFTVGSLTFALREVIAALPVYRTYVGGDEPGSVSRRDQAYVQAAVAEAKRRNPRTAESLFDFLGDTLLLRTATHFRPEARAELASFVRKVQQVTGPVMAKGVEDTAFYVYNRLVALNEVGGEPDQFGTSVVAFHRQNAERLRRRPHTMVTTATHDTKRGEDVRTRVAVLSELPREWRSALRRWAILNRRKKTVVDGQPAPDRNDEYLLYQTLLGAWPIEPLDAAGFAAFRARIVAYMEKATREAKVHTSWVNPNEPYDAAVHTFVERLLPDGGEDPFLDDFRPVQRRVAFYGQLNGLVQALLKHTAPGVADTYQGTELWDLSLVDPDNRRPVDYARRRALLADLQARTESDGGDLRALARELLAADYDGRVKLYVVYRALTFRRAHAALFAHGGYQPLEAGGTKREHVVAFARTLDDSRAVVVAPRLVVRLTGGVERPPCGEAVWQDTWLALPHERADQAYRDRFTGAVLAVGHDGGVPGLPLAEVCRDFPLALLERVG